MMTMNKKNVCIVGCGIVGSVIANELSSHGYGVYICDKRKHIGGNLYDFIDDYGIRVQKYGPHIFHTNNKKIYDYLSTKCDLVDYNLICGSNINGNCVRTPFDFSSIDIFFPDEASAIKERIKNNYLNKDRTSIIELLNSDDIYIKKFANFLYENDYLPYASKQWNIPIDEIDAEIFERVPIIFSYEGKYFYDKYQAIPKNGFTSIFDKLLSNRNIKILLEYDAYDHISIDSNHAYIDLNDNIEKIIYTGPIDELFKYKYGKLPYRSLEFCWKHLNIKSFQNMPVVAYPKAKKITRITEYNKLPFQSSEGTTICLESPKKYIKDKDADPYYPVVTDESKRIYDMYYKECKKSDNLYCCGRLADFKYYNIDQAIERALKVSEDIINERR